MNWKRIFCKMIFFNVFKKDIASNPLVSDSTLKIWLILPHGIRTLGKSIALLLLYFTSVAVTEKVQKKSHHSPLS